MKVNLRDAIIKLIQDSGYMAINKGELIKALMDLLGEVGTLKEHEEWIRKLEGILVRANADNIMWIAVDSPLKEDYQTQEVKGHPSGITGVIRRR